MDRARFGLYPPGSTFKLVTAAAALSQDRGPRDARATLPFAAGGRSGTVVDGRLVRDDEGHTAHGTIGMEDAMIVSCNAYYAQLGRAVGWPALREMGRRFGNRRWATRPTRPASARTRSRARTARRRSWRRR